MSSVMKMCRRCLGEKIEWISVSWWRKPFFNFLIYKMEMKITVVLLASQVLYKTGMERYWVNALEIISCYANIHYYCGYWIVCLLLLLFASGLIEHEGRDVVIALKTKQAIRNVIAKALKSLTFLSSRGIIDKYESLEMNKVSKQFPMLLDSINPTLTSEILL